jgi:hypothetical protein
MEVARCNETMTKVFRLRDMYLGLGTEIIVWIGIKIFFNKVNGVTKMNRWWMGVYHRGGIVQNQPFPAVASPPVCIAELPRGQAHELIATPRNEIFQIPIWMLYYPGQEPNPPPNYNPLPVVFDIRLEEYRQIIARFI